MTPSRRPRYEHGCGQSGARSQAMALLWTRAAACAREERPGTSTLTSSVERAFGLGEVASFAGRLLGRGLPNPELNYAPFRRELNGAVEGAGTASNPRTNTREPWIGTSKVAWRTRRSMWETPLGQAHTPMQRQSHRSMHASPQRLALGYAAHLYLEHRLAAVCAIVGGRRVCNGWGCDPLREVRT